MDAQAILDRLKKAKVDVRLSSDKLQLWPGSRVPEDLRETIRERKAEIMTALRRPTIVDMPPEWHAGEIARLVEEQGVCVFWSNLFGEMIAFVKEGSCPGKVPAGVVAYTSRELHVLSLKDPGPETRRLVHEAKRKGGVIK